jgi:hypothetical protein
VTEEVDPRGVPTFYTYAYGAYNPALHAGDGDLVQVSYADGSFEDYQYDPIFHHVTQTADALGVTETDTYDPSTSGGKKAVGSRCPASPSRVDNGGARPVPWPFASRSASLLLPPLRSPREIGA